MNKYFLFVLVFSMSYIGTFAKTGILTGKVIQEIKGQKVGLPFSTVFLEGTTIGGITDEEGNFNISAPLGQYTIVASQIGYKTVKKHIELNADKVSIIIETKIETIAINGVEVVAKMNRESEVALIMEQKKASIAIEAIGARELSIKGVGDAASAATKITSITKQEGSGSLNVRGLGDRYNTTTLNKLPLPSDNPERKNVNLELFTTDIISHISIEKVFSSSIYGDFGGANINITSKRLIGNPFLEVRIDVGQNSTVTKLNNFMRLDGPTNMGLHSEDVHAISSINDRELYKFANSWDPLTTDVTPDISFGISGGKTFTLGSGELNAFFTASFENEKKFTERIERIVSATGVPRSDMTGEEYSYGTQSNSMLNINYSLKNTEVYFNSVFLNSSDESIISLYGNIRDVGEHAFRRKAEFERNTILINQLLGEHNISNGKRFTWGLAYNKVLNTIPDRRQTRFVTYDESTNEGEMDTEPAGANFRYFHDYTDDEIAGNAVFDKEIGYDEDGNYKHKLIIGYSGSFKNRVFKKFQFNHDVNDAGVIFDVDNIDTFFNNTEFLNEAFDIVIVDPRDENGKEKYGEDYQGIINKNAVYGLWEWNISSNLTLLFGLRGEYVSQKITTRANQIIGCGNNVKTFAFDKIAILPSLVSKYAIKENQNLRFAASKTYTLPKLHEMPFMSFTGISEEIYGNPYLKPSDVYNIDLKWELFPQNGMFSAAAFGKYITNPINKTTLAGTQNSYFVANTGDWAYVYGFELEAKRNLYKTKSKNLFASGNLSLMSSKMELDKDKIKKETEYNFNSNFNNDISALQGAAPILANLAVGYSYKRNNNKVSATMVYNYTSDRLYSIGQSGRGNEYECATNTLDFIFKSAVGSLAVDCKITNILNADYTLEQKNNVAENATHVIRQYKKGIGFSLGLKYKF